MNGHGRPKGDYHEWPRAATRWPVTMSGYGVSCLYLVADHGYPVASGHPWQAMVGHGQWPPKGTNGKWLWPVFQLKFLVMMAPHHSWPLVALSDHNDHWSSHGGHKIRAICGLRGWKCPIIIGYGRRMWPMATLVFIVDVRLHCLALYQLV